MSYINEFEIELEKKLNGSEDTATIIKWVVRFLILHLNAFYQAIKADFLDQPAGLRADIKTFLALPIPQAVWIKMKQFCDGDFVSFVEVK